MSRDENRNITSLSRRSALTTLSTAAIGAVATIDVGSAGVAADTELLALDKQLTACQAEFARVRTLHGGDWEDAMSAANERGTDLIWTILHTKPSTLAGLAVLGRALQCEVSWWHTELNGDVLEDIDRLAKKLADAVVAVAANSVRGVS